MPKMPTLMDPMGVTSQWAAAERQVEGERAERLFYDPFAKVFAGADGHRLRIDMAERAGGESSYPAIRTRFFDDWALYAAAHIRQIVLLAVGMDARAFRLRWPDGTVVFEVDRPCVLDEKSRLLAPLEAKPACDRRVVAADLLLEAWQDRLIQAGFSIEQPALFLVEGLTPYLDLAQAKGLFAGVRSVAAPGSLLGADFIGESFLRSPFTQAYLAQLRTLGVPWQFGTDHPEDFVAEYGWQATATMPGDPDANWGRWPFPAARGVAPWPKVYLLRGRLPAQLVATKAEQRD